MFSHRYGISRTYQFHKRECVIDYGMVPVRRCCSGGAAHHNRIILPCTQDQALHLAHFDYVLRLIGVVHSTFSVDAVLHRLYSSWPDRRAALVLPYAADQWWVLHDACPVWDQQACISA